LKRLADVGAILLDAYVASNETASLLLAARRLQISPLAYPVTLADVDHLSLKKSLGRSMAVVGRPPGAKGSGNSTKRLRLRVEGVAPGVDGVLQGG